MRHDEKRKKAQQAAGQLMQQARRARQGGKPAEAARALHEAVGHCRQAGLRSTHARCLALLGQLARDQANLDQALAHYQEALTIYQKLGDSDGVAHTVRHIGDIHYDAGRPAQAAACFAEALTIYRNHPKSSSLDLANAIRSMALLQSDQQAVDEAIALWQEARQLYAAAGISEGVAECNLRLGKLDSLP